MSDYHKIMRRASDIQMSPEFKPYTAVRILTGLQDENNADIVYESGNFNTGRVLEIKNEWGTQEQADDILADVNGWAYQPYEATGAMLNPAAQLGDAVDVNGIYSGIYVKNTTFGGLMPADISAPEDEEINHEIPYESRQDRNYTRMVKNMRATFKIQASQIAAKVEATSTGEAFGWTLTENQWKLWSGNENNPILIANSSGLTVNGSGEFTGVVKASQFLNSAGQPMATQDQVSAVMGSYAAGGIGGGYFFNSATQAGTQVYPDYFYCYRLGVHGDIYCDGSAYNKDLRVWDGGSYVRAEWQYKSFSVEVPNDFHVLDTSIIYQQSGIRVLSYNTSYISHGSTSKSAGSITYLGR